MPQPTAATAPIVRHAGDGDAIWAMGSRFTLTLRSSETNEGLSMQEVLAPVGSAPPLHRHSREAEVFVLLDGAMIYRAGDQTVELKAGSSIYLPRGLPHAFRVVGDRPARFLAITVPGGLERLYEEVGRPAAGSGLPEPPRPEDVAAWLRASPQYGLEVVGPPVAAPTA